MLKLKLKKLYKKSNGKTRFLTLVSICLVAVLAVGLVAPLVKASVNSEINQLQQDNAKNRDIVANLQDQALSYQDAVDKLHAAITTLQNQIDNNVAEQNRLKGEIAKSQIELDKQKGFLGDTVKSLYVQGHISTLEMFASSQDLSDFIDKQVYEGNVQAQVKLTLDKVIKLNNELKEKELQIEKLIADQTQKQNELIAARDKQNDLLSYNQQQQYNFNQKTKNNQARIDELIAAQRRANFSTDGGYYFLRFPGAVKGFNPGNYPYRNAGFGMSPGPGCVDNDGPDPWGYCTRQCVSYAAWAVLASGRAAPRYYGNAIDWVNGAYAHGIPVYRTPEPGDIAISTSGYWGHAMYVESVSGGTFNTSEYNTYLTGRLSYQTRTY